MSLPFKTVQEFLAVRNKNEIVLSDFFVLLDKLNFNNLVGVFTKNTFIRLIYIKKWLREIGRLCGIKIKLKISLSAHKPYMLESGVVGLSFKDFLKPSFSFFALSHETAHFLLMCIDYYSQLKALNREFLTEINSPIEYCANIITLMIFERCISVVQKAEYRKKISQFIDSLKISMTEF